MPQSGSVLVQIDSILTKVFDLTTPAASLNYRKRIALANGTGANQADLVFHDQKVLAAGGSDDYDLAGVMTDTFGDVLTFARIRVMMIYCAAANPSTMEVGNSPVNAWREWNGGTIQTVTIRPGGLFLVVAPDATGYFVTAGTADRLKILNNSGSASGIYDIVLIGASA